MYCVFIFKRAKASERQRAMIGKTYHIQTCTWNDVCNVLYFYNQAGQSQWTPARDDWKNISHPDMHLKRRLRCIVFYMHFDQTTANASERSVFKIAIWEHALFWHSSWYMICNDFVYWRVNFVAFYTILKHGWLRSAVFLHSTQRLTPLWVTQSVAKNRTMGQAYCECHSFYSSLAKSLDCWEKKQY